MKNFFTLFAHGDTFDVDEYLKTTSLEFDHVWHRGDQKRYACVEAPHETSGVEVVLGNGHVLTLREQQRIAVEFLSNHCDQLRNLARFPGVGTFILGFHYEVELDDSLLGFCLSPTVQLMRHALDVGIEPTFYIVLDRSHELEQQY